MRIVLPYNMHFGKYNTDIIAGGIEKFCHQIVETFDDVHVVNIDNNETAKDNANKIIDYSRKVDADIIISNWYQASFVGSHILDSEFPIMLILHGCIGMGSLLSTINNLREKEHSCFMVSEFQFDFYKSMADRFRTNVAIDGYIDSSYVKGNKPELLEIEYDCVTIGRCCPLEKRPFLLKEYLKDTDYKTVLMSNTPRDEKERTYLEKNKKYDGVLFDLEHKEVMKTLSKSMTYFSTSWQETWGITALEALSHGVPVILNSKDNKHGSTIIPSQDNHYRMIDHDPNELIKAIESLRGCDRKEIQDKTWDKHNHNNWKNKFSNMIDSTVEKYKKPNLVQFM